MSKMNVWLRKKQKLFLVIICCVIMITWYGGSALMKILPSGRKSDKGSLFGKSYKAEEIQQLQWGIMRLMRGRQPVTPDMAKGKAWEVLLLNQAAERMGIRATDADVEDYLRRSFPAKSGGGMDDTAYAQFLSDAQMSHREHERLVKSLLAADLVQTAVIENVSLTKDEAWLWYSEENHQIKTRFLQVRAEDAGLLAKADDAALKAFYAERADRPREMGGYQEPEKIKIECVMAPFKKYADAVTVTQAEIKAYYDTHPEEFRAPKPADAPKDEAKPDSAAAKADTDAVTVESADAKKEEAKAPLKPFDEVKAEIEKTLRDKAARKKAEEVMKAVNAHVCNALEVPFGSDEVRTMDLQPVAEQYGLEYRCTDFFAANEAAAKLPGAFDLAAKAFGRGASSLRVPSAPMNADDGVFIYQTLESRAPCPADFESVKAQVEKDLRLLRGMEIAVHAAEAGLKATQMDEARKLVAQYVQEQLTAAGDQPALKERTAESFVTAGETDFFGRPKEYVNYDGTRFRYLLGIGLPGNHNYAGYGDIAFGLNADQIGIAVEPRGAQAVFLLQRSGGRAADRAAFDKDADRIVSDLRNKKREAVLLAWRQDLLTRAQPSDTVLKSLALLSGDAAE